MKIILPTSPPSILILVVIASRHESHVETNLWPSRFGGKVQSWSREMIGSDEFPFNDPFLDPKSREGGGKGKRGKEGGRNTILPVISHGIATELFLLRHSWTFHAPLKTALYLPLPRTRDVPLPRLLPVLGQKSSRSTGKKGRNKWLVPRFLFLRLSSPHSTYDDPLSNSRNLDSIVDRVWGCVYPSWPIRPRFRFGFARLVGHSILTLRRDSMIRRRSLRETKERISRWMLNLGF